MKRGTREKFTRKFFLKSLPAKNMSTTIIVMILTSFVCLTQSSPSQPTQTIVVNTQKIRNSLKSLVLDPVLKSTKLSLFSPQNPSTPSSLTDYEYEDTAAASSASSPSRFEPNGASSNPDGNRFFFLENNAPPPTILQPYQYPPGAAYFPLIPGSQYVPSFPQNINGFAPVVPQQHQQLATTGVAKKKPVKPKAVNKQKSNNDMKSSESSKSISISSAGPSGGLAFKWGSAQLTFKRGFNGPEISLGSASSASSTQKVVKKPPSASSSSSSYVIPKKQPSSANRKPSPTVSGPRISFSFGGGSKDAAESGESAVFSLPSISIGRGSETKTVNTYYPKNNNKYYPKAEPEPEPRPKMTIQLPDLPKTVIESNLRLPAIKLKLNSSPLLKVTTNSRDPLEPKEPLNETNTQDIFKTPEPFPLKFKNGTIIPLSSTMSPLVEIGQTPGPHSFTGYKGSPEYNNNPILYSYQQPAPHPPPATNSYHHQQQQQYNHGQYHSSQHQYANQQQSNEGYAYYNNQRQGDAAGRRSSQMMMVASPAQNYASYQAPPSHHPQPNEWAPASPANAYRSNAYNSLHQGPPPSYGGQHQQQQSYGYNNQYNSHHNQEYSSYGYNRTTTAKPDLKEGKEIIVYDGVGPKDRPQIVVNVKPRILFMQGNGSRYQIPKDKQPFLKVLTNPTFITTTTTKAPYYHSYGIKSPGEVRKLDYGYAVNGVSPAPPSGSTIAPPSTTSSSSSGSTPKEDEELEGDDADDDYDDDEDKDKDSDKSSTSTTTSAPSRDTDKEEKEKDDKKDDEEGDDYDDNEDKDDKKKDSSSTTTTTTAPSTTTSSSSSTTSKTTTTTESSSSKKDEESEDDAEDEDEEESMKKAALKIQTTTTTSTTTATPSTATRKRKVNSVAANFRIRKNESLRIKTNQKSVTKVYESLVTPPSSTTSSPTSTSTTTASSPKDVDFDEDEGDDDGEDKIKEDKEEKKKISSLSVSSSRNGK